jgi:hypothetical protein
MTIEGSLPSPQFTGRALAAVVPTENEQLICVYVAEVDDVRCFLLIINHLLRLLES